MAEIVVKISISSDVYETWSEYENGSLEIVKKELEKDFKKTCSDLGIDYTEIEVVCKQ